MDLPSGVTDTYMKAMNVLHRGLLTVSGGRIGGQLGSMPVVELHTTGRRIGATRKVMLTAPVHDGDTYVLVASKGGDDRDPDWYRNLLAEPEIALGIGGETLPYSARTADEAEKAELWPKIVASYKGYAGYQAKTDRDIPVVICTPR